jgi:hypothetical protein
MLSLLALLAVCEHSGVQTTSARTAAAAAPVCEAHFLAALGCCLSKQHTEGAVAVVEQQQLKQRPDQHRQSV